MNFLAWFNPKMRLKRWLALTLLGIIIMCYSISQIIVLNVVEPKIIFLIIIEFVIGFLLIIFGILGIQKRTLEIFIQANGVSAKKLDEKDIKIDSLIFDKKIYENGPKVVVIGGGSGTNEIIKGLKGYTNNITEIITIADTDKEKMQGSSKNSLHLLPYSNVKTSIAALSNNEEVMKTLLDHEFSEEKLNGLNFGDIYLLAMKEMFGNVSTSIKKSTEVLNIAGEVVPVSLDPITVCAELTDGTVVKTKEKIPVVVRERIDAITRVYIEPTNAMVAPRALEAIREADIIVIGPGKLYTDIIPILLVKGVINEIRESKAKKVYVANIMSDEGQTDRYKLSDHIKAITDHVGENIFEFCIADTGNIMPEYLRLYHKQARDVVEVDKDAVKKLGTRVIQKEMAKVVDGRIRHDSDILAMTIIEIVLTEMKYDDDNENDILATTLETIVKEEKRKHKKENRLKRRKGFGKQDTTDVEKVVLEDKKESKFSEKYKNRIETIQKADNKKKEEEKKMIENFFGVKIKENKKNEDKRSKEEIAKEKLRENSTLNTECIEKGKNNFQDTAKFNTLSIHNIMRELNEDDISIKEKAKDIYTNNINEKDIIREKLEEVKKKAEKEEREEKTKTKTKTTKTKVKTRRSTRKKDEELSDAEKAKLLLKEMNKLEKKREQKRRK